MQVVECYDPELMSWTLLYHNLGTQPRQLVTGNLQGGSKNYMSHL